MLHRPLVLLGAAVLALVLAAPAAAVDVYVRVEGPKTTIFGSRWQLVTPVTGTFAPPDGPEMTLAGATAFGALERASRLGEFYYRVQSTGFGPYVDRIGRVTAGATTGWVYKVNGVSPPVGADQFQLKEGDKVLWYHATFGPSGGPKTLRLRIRPNPLGHPARYCLVTLAQDDNGRTERVAGVTFERDGRRMWSRTGRVCPRGHWHTYRALKRGHVRSELVVPLRRGSP